LTITNENDTSPKPATVVSKLVAGTGITLTPPSGIGVVTVEGTITGALPATTVTGPDAFGAAAAVGTATKYARQDHNHGLPSLPGGHPILRALHFTYATANLDTGAPLYVPTPGDFLLDAWISVDTAFDGTTPLGDLLIQGFAGFIATINTALSIHVFQDMKTAWIVGPTGTMFDSDENNDIAALSSYLLALQYVPSKFATNAPVCMVVSKDGTPTGGDPGSTVGAGTLYLVTATPI